MEELDFLLGDFSCSWVNLTVDPPTTGSAEWNTERTMRGHFYVMDQTMPGLKCKLIFGRDPLTASFITYYYDNFGNFGTTTSPGWRNGVLVFTGEYYAFGAKTVFLEEFTREGENHYVKKGFHLVDGDRVPVDIIECHRKR
ncbi:hypothetical protein [Goodfellowiella coeruleoviolacea]|uniref:Uncharacterized protein n=1 Tax=Goodfellowiella coeruleoviolacea TaxID=334858 RepID=A0AAE3GLL4_9PSEU|nr:hypothetical protein [Goodfellowiella coeruleoviolacea]MCP2170275.1 hypothetical protein [Goodfellowiella coeruleoviolacea]